MQDASGSLETETWNGALAIRWGHSTLHNLRFTILVAQSQSSILPWARFRELPIWPSWEPCSRRRLYLASLLCSWRCGQLKILVAYRTRCGGCIRSDDDISIFIYTQNTAPLSLICFQFYWKLQSRDPQQEGCYSLYPPTQARASSLVCRWPGIAKWNGHWNLESVGEFFSLGGSFAMF